MYRTEKIAVPNPGRWWWWLVLQTARSTQPPRRPHKQWRWSKWEAIPLPILWSSQWLIKHECGPQSWLSEGPQGTHEDGWNSGEKRWWAGHWTGAVGCVVILAQKHCILLKRTFAQPWILAGLGIRSFAHCSMLMCSCAHFAQDKWVTVSKLLRSFRGNEQSWAICSGRSEEMRNLSELLISLMKKWANERLAQKIWLKNLKYCFTVFYSRFFFVKKWANRIFLLPSPFLVRDVSESLILLKSNERCEWIAHFAHQKRATMSNSLRLLRGNERCEWISHFAHQKWANEWISHFLSESLIFLTQKTSNSLRNQMSEFPTLNCRSPNPNFQHTTLAPKF